MTFRSRLTFASAFTVLFAGASMLGAVVPMTAAAEPVPVAPRPKSPDARRQSETKGNGSLEERLRAAGIDPEQARRLRQRSQSGERLDDDEAALLRRAHEALGQNHRAAGGQARALFHHDKTGLEPITEMTAQDRYFGEDGGLYGGGKNTPPEPHRKAALEARDRIEPLASDGKPSKDGKILLISISMSNATQEFSMFKRIADGDQAKSADLQIVDCAQGGKAMAEWAAADSAPWSVALQRIAEAGASPEQVQVAWIKLANMGPRGDLEEHGRKLERDTLAVVQNAKATFPNLQLVYLGSRIYGGYAGRGLNPEPYAYESAFVARWLIQNQIAGKKELNYDPGTGDVKSAVLLWGPYLWGDGVTPRAADKLVWLRDDYVDDGTHPSMSGREKVAMLLLDFFKNDETAKTWFVK